MSRLTNKDCHKYEDFVFSLRNKLITENEINDSIYKKLKSLEELEEESGVEFITLVKMFKDDVYINYGGIVGEIGHIYKEHIKSIEHWPVWGFTVDGVEYAFKDRGKTWALDKEEFYEKLSKQKN